MCADYEVERTTKAFQIIIVSSPDKILNVNCDYKTQHTPQMSTVALITLPEIQLILRERTQYKMDILCSHVY